MAKLSIHLKRMTVTIEGESPLITARFSEPPEHGFSTLDEEFRASLYPMGAEFGFPSNAIHSALSAAYGGPLSGILTITGGGLLKIRGPGPQMHTYAVVRSGSPKLVYRGEFWPWEIDINLMYDPDLIAEKGVLNLFRLAGFKVGIGDRRPEKNGTFGVFSVKTYTQNGIGA